MKKRSWFTAAVPASDPTRGDIDIYDRIGTWGVTIADFRDALNALGDVQQINLRINSPGGEVFDGFAMYNMLSRHPARVVATVDGIAASMASVVAMAADHIAMPENAMMMVHNPAAGLMGFYTAEDMRTEAEVLDKIAQGMVGAYVYKTKLPPDQVSLLLEAVTWMTADEAVAQGFADEVLPARQLQANFDLTRMFASVPPAALALMQGAAPDWTVGAERDLPIDENAAWDGAAAAERVLDAAGFNGDKPDPAYARDAFLAYDAANAALKGSYKLPFADVVGGKLTAIAAGLDNAASRLPQTDIPKDVKDRAEAVLQHYRDRRKQQQGVASASAERERAANIAAACQIAGRPDLAAGFIAAGKSIAQAMAELALLAAQRAGPNLDPRHNPADPDPGRDDGALSWGRVIERLNRRHGAQA
jgi:ATP-dependent protease ClpP protease subunit